MRPPSGPAQPAAVLQGSRRGSVPGGRLHCRRHHCQRPSPGWLALRLSKQEGSPPLPLPVLLLQQPLRTRRASTRRSEPPKRTSPVGTWTSVTLSTLQPGHFLRHWPHLLPLSWPASRSSSAHLSLPPALFPASSGGQWGAEPPALDSKEPLLGAQVFRDLKVTKGQAKAFLFQPLRLGLGP